MPGEGSHQAGLKLFEEGLYERALREFAGALREEETSERWNDWGAAQAGLHRAEEAEQGFRRALEIDSSNAQAAANLGGLLFELGRHGEARRFLEVSLAGLDESQRSVALRLLREIQAKLQPLKILIVHETLPRPDVNGSDVCFMQILNELLLQGHELTYVARDGAGREQYTSPLERLGVKVFSHDLERLRRFEFDDPPA